jgi:thiol-disulfide isomerase/thioredoxin
MEATTSRLYYSESIDSSIRPTDDLYKMPSRRAFATGSNIREAASLAEIDRLLLQSIHQDRIAIIRFHAPYCKACQAVAPKFDHLARSYPFIDFVQVALPKQNADKEEILTTLQVPSIPWGQLWHPDVGLVEELSLNPKYFADFVAIVQSYQEASCELQQDMWLETGVYGAPYYRKERILEEEPAYQ